jgi:hypothetical protein
MRLVVYLTGILKAQDMFAPRLDGTDPAILIIGFCYGIYGNPVIVQQPICTNFFGHGGMNPIDN